MPVRKKKLLKAPKNAYNEYEASDQSVSDKIDGIMVPAFRQVLDLARKEGYRFRDVMWMASDLIHVMGSQAILEAALVRYNAVSNEPRKE